MRTPEHITRRAAEELVRVVAEHPGDVLAVQAQLVDLAAVLAGEPAPSRRRTTDVRRGRTRPPKPLSLNDATSRVMGYVRPAPGSAVAAALEQLRTTVLRWTPPDNIPLPPHSAPPPRPERPS